MGRNPYTPSLSDIAKQLLLKEQIKKVGSNIENTKSKASKIYIEAISVEDVELDRLEGVESFTLRVTLFNDNTDDESYTDEDVVILSFKVADLPKECPKLVEVFEREFGESFEVVEGMLDEESLSEIFESERDASEAIKEYLKAEWS